MSERKRNVLIGVFVLGSLVALAILIVKFGEEPEWFSKRYNITAKFERIAGVREGTEVDLAGVWAGSVLRVTLANRSRPSEGVDVIMQIDPEFSVPRGSVAEVIQPLMGQPKININPPPPAEPAPLLPKDGTALIRGKVTNPLDSIIDPKIIATVEGTAAQIRDLAKELKPTARALTDLLERRPIEELQTPEAQAKQLTANLSTAIQRLYLLMTHIDEVLGDKATQLGLKETIANVRVASQNAVVATEQFKQTTADARVLLAHMDATVDTTHKHIDELGKKLQGNSDQLARTLDYFAAAGRQLAEGKGTLGMFLRDSRFYEELLLTVERLKAAAADLQVTVKQWQNQGFPVKLR